MTSFRGHRGLMAKLAPSGVEQDEAPLCAATIAPFAHRTGSESPRAAINCSP